MGRKLLRALLQSESCWHHSAWCHWTSAYHGGARHRTNPLWHPLFSASQTCFWELNRRSVHAHEIRWQILQHNKIEGKNQGAQDHHQKHAFCRWHSSHLAHWARSTVPRGQSLPSPQGLWSWLSDETDVLGQDVDTPPTITTENYKYEVVHQFTHLGSTISDNLSLDSEIIIWIGKAATTLGWLATCVWRTPSWPLSPRWQYTMPVSSAPSHTGVNLDNLCQARTEAVQFSLAVS